MKKNVQTKDLLCLCLLDFIYQLLRGTLGGESEGKTGRTLAVVQQVPLVMEEPISVGFQLHSIVESAGSHSKYKWLAFPGSNLNIHHK